MRRVILSFATGNEQYVAMAKALGVSLQVHGSQTPRALITDRTNDSELQAIWPKLIAPPAGYDHWFLKLCALEATDADAVLFLDGDGLAFQNADRIFDELQGQPFVVQGKWETDPGDWYGPMKAKMDELGLERIPKFSGGFMYYERQPETERLLKKVFELRDGYDGLGLRRNGGHVVDEVCISLGMALTAVGTVVPDSANYSITPWRRIGPMHLDVLRGECLFYRLNPGLERCKPVIYHSAMAKWDIAYWREANRLLGYYRSTTPVYLRRSLIRNIEFRLRKLLVARIKKR